MNEKQTELDRREKIPISTFAILLVALQIFRWILSVFGTQTIDRPSRKN